MNSLLSRFARERKLVSEHTVRPNLFRPNKNLKTSVFFIDDLSCAQIVDIARKCMASPMGNRRPNEEIVLFGWARFDKSAVPEAGLKLCIDGYCEDRHADIISWPIDRDGQKQKQQLLAAASCPVLLPSPKVLYKPPYDVTAAPEDG